MTTLFAQLPLVFETHDSYTFETFVAGDNELAVGIVRQCVQAFDDHQGEKQILLWAEKACGKSHLLQACCQYAANLGRTVCYLPAREILSYEASVLDDMEQLNLLCIDDVDALFGDTAWEEALFDLINRCRERQTSLILSTSGAPDNLVVRLADLRSRLHWGPVFQLKSLSDDKKIIALQLRANQRGLVLQENVAEYLLRRLPRDLNTLFEKLDELDEASLISQRKLTIPFIKQVLDQR